MEQNGNIKKIDWIILFVISCGLFVCYFHGDLAVTTYHSINLWNCLADGNSVFDFYSYNYQNGEVYTISNMWYQIAAVYDFFLYIVFAIWDLPLWILEHAFNIDVLASLVCLTYAKAIVLLFGGLTAKVIHDICIELNLKKWEAELCAYIYMTSCIYMTVILVIGQYDIIGIFFSLLGVYSYIRKEQKKFIFWFTIAVCFKYFALFIFVPLLLLREKNICKIIKNLIIAISITGGETCLFKIFGSLDGREGVAKSFLTQLMSDNIECSNGKISIFLVAYVVLCVWCYCYEITDYETEKYLGIWVSVAAFATIFIGARTQVYWIILILPYISILVVLNKTRYYTNLILETVIATTAILNMAVMNTGMFYMIHMVRSVVGKVFGSLPIEEYSMEAMLFFTDKLGCTEIVQIVINSVFVGATIFFLYINFKPKNSQGDSIEKTYKWLIHFRLLINTCILTLPIVMYIWLMKR